MRRAAALLLPILLAACADRIVDPGAPSIRSGRRLASFIPADAYTMRVLPSLDPTSGSEVWDLNDLGEAVGVSGQRAVIWTADGVRDLGAGAECCSSASGINNRHQVVGAYADRGSGRAFVLSPGGSIVTLPDGGAVARAMHINNVGVIVGGIFNGGRGTAAVWRPDGAGNYTLTQLDPPAGFNAAFGMDINDAGMIVGYVFSPEQTRAAMWTLSGDFTDLGPGALVAVNRSGEYIGVVNDPVLGNRGFRGIGTTRTYLNGAINPTPLDINDEGIVSGYHISSLEPYVETGLLWEGPDPTPFTPDFLIGQRRPHAINNSGLVGGGIGPYAVLWEPPKPKDATPPDVSAEVQGTAGINGWYVSDVTVRWTAKDPESPITSPPCVEDPLTTDVASYDFSCKAISSGGTTTKVVTVKRDATAPVITFTGAAASYDANEMVDIGCAATDAMSGIATSACPSLHLPAYAVGIGAHTLSAIASDNAGNRASKSVDFTVTVTVNAFAALAMQWTDSHGVANSLIAKAQHGSRKALLNEIDAQSGKHIPADKAAVLRALAAALP